jgi:DNA-binding NarL/FixJ family response regulator
VGVVRVVVGDDHPLMLEALRDRLERDGTIHVVATARSGEELVRQVRQHRPDVVLTDQAMPGLNGTEAARAIVSEDPGARVLILSAHDDESLIVEAIEAGAVGYLTKSVTGVELVRKVHEVAAGTYSFDAPALRRLVARVRGDVGGAPALSARELEVLALAAEGCTNNEIAARLGLSPQTVKTYLDRVFTKLGVNDRTAAVRVAMQRGLLR